jgi:hypothetical protein
VDSSYFLYGNNVTNQTLQYSANANGQISASVVTSERPGISDGSANAAVGFHFQPMVAGTLTISATPTYSFEWSANWLNSSYYVISTGIVNLMIRGMDATGVTPNGGSAFSAYKAWVESTDYSPPRFGFQFGVQQPNSVSLDVTPPFSYLCIVLVDVQAIGMGWPGSLAVAMASATVPSISYAFVGLSGPPGPMPGR